jgi:chemotaxis protein MotB
MADHGDGGMLEEEHEEHVNHEAWVIPYADMLTLLMALFMMLFAISSVDLKKFEALAASLNAEFGGGDRSIVEGGESVFDGAGPEAAPAPVVGPTRAEQAEEALQREEARERAAAVESQQLHAIEEQIRERAVLAGIADSVQFRREARGLVVTIVTDQVMFQPGQAEVQPGGAALLREVATAISDLPNQVAVEGHTDDVPISNSLFRSNWELSTARATEVLRYLVDELGIPAGRVSASGYGEQRPVAANDTPQGRAQNRRVELAVLSEVTG